jgi:hypothetical protein
VRGEIFLLKCSAVAATLGAAALIWSILRRVNPRAQLLGTAAFLWNPAIIWELAGDGHNDALMIALTLLGIAWILRHRYPAAMAVMSLAILTKYLPLILAPLYVVHAWRTAGDRTRLMADALRGAALSAGVIIVLFFPLWVGVQTFMGVRVNGAPGSSGSTATMAREVLERLWPHAQWEGIVWAVVLVALVICIMWQARRIADDMSLLRASALVWLLFVLLFCPTYWPWYATMPVALAALVAEPPLLIIAVTLSFSARVIAPLTMLFVHETISRRLFLGATWIVGVGVPLLVLVQQRGWRDNR